MSTVTQDLLIGTDPAGGVDLGGFLVRPIVDAAATGGHVTVVDHVIPPRMLASPWHVHHTTVEISIVVSGTIGARIGDREVTAGVGEVVYKPTGIWHAFWNPTDEPARIVELLTPSGFEHFFTDAADAIGPDGPDLQRFGELVARHDLDVDPSVGPDLIERHELTRATV